MVGSVWKAVGLAPRGTEINCVVGPVDQSIVASEPRFAQNERDRAEFGDLKHHVFQVLVDQELDGDLVGEVADHGGSAIDNRENLGNGLSAELQAVFESEILIRKKKSRSNGGLRKSRTPRLGRVHPVGDAGTRARDATCEQTRVCKATSMRTPRTVRTAGITRERERPGVDIPSACTAA
jgi:hypothetical protein